MKISSSKKLWQLNHALRYSTQAASEKNTTDTPQDSTSISSQALSLAHQYKTKQIENEGIDITAKRSIQPSEVVFSADGKGKKIQATPSSAKSETGKDDEDGEGIKMSTTIRKQIAEVKKEIEAVQNELNVQGDAPSEEESVTEESSLLNMPLGDQHEGKKILQEKLSQLTGRLQLLLAALAKALKAEAGAGVKKNQGKPALDAS